MKRSHPIRPALRQIARHALHVLFKLALRLRSRPYPITREGVTLVIAPHQDDEALGCGGLILTQRRSGRDVRIAYVTDGSASHPGHPSMSPAILVARRIAEATQATGLLGVEASRLNFLGAQDGSLAHLTPTEAAALTLKIAETLAATRPTEIFLPCRHDGSSEHDAAFLLVQRAVQAGATRPRLLEYPIWSWWNPRLLWRPLLTSRRVWRAEFGRQSEQKRRALACYTSQVETTPQWPNPVLSAEFLSFFGSGTEFFFEP